MQHQHSYLQYLEMSQKNKWHRSLFGSDSVCEKILGLIAIKSEADKPLTISAIMQFQDLGSPGTIHRRLEVLRRAGLIEQVFKNSDRRTKYLVPTEVAASYFKTMDDVIELVALNSHEKVLT
jgi:DNA-binding transcriptional regulator GbsR (MarR family)